MPDPAPKSFIEAQLPVSKLSKECYKERKANYSQTLTGLGKWWGRKPLILVRAALLGLLMPATADPRRDREIYLKILTMDDDGMLRRLAKRIPLKTLYARLTPREREQVFGRDVDAEKPRFRKGVTKAEKDALQHKVFLRMSYDERLEYCDRPEQIDGPSETAWAEINAHLGTAAASLVELMQELGHRRFGRVPRVGDAFCGGGSIPFEAARIGCEAYGSDLNPVAALLTWAALNIVGGGEETAAAVRRAQEEVYAAVDRQITAWGIEHNEAGDRADAYLYCCETRCPECGWTIPLAPSWVIGEKSRCIAVLQPEPDGRRFTINIRSGVDEAAMRAAKAAGTVGGSALTCPNPACRKSTPIAMLRGDRRGRNGSVYGLRLWENSDVVPRSDDVFQERLYCIRYVHTWFDEQGRERTTRTFQAPDPADLKREAKVLKLLRQHFDAWQAAGYIPSAKIEPGYNTDQPIRERGWTHWHHLFNPRQLLLNGLLAKEGATHQGDNKRFQVSFLLGLQRAVDHNSRLSGWSASIGKEIVDHVFANQALNTLFNNGTRSCVDIKSAYILNLKHSLIASSGIVRPEDARRIQVYNDIWFTDPSYADAINYDELAVFFLAWYATRLPGLFVDWYSEAKAALAVKGCDEGFRKAMVECYSTMTKYMPNDGYHFVTFTHQNASVWADLTLILWASGLSVTAAWCVATETDSALKSGNYVQGTVLLVLKKQTEDTTAFLDEIIPEVEQEVRDQLDAMLSLDDQEDPNFSDTDYQLAAYAAALRVLTRYRHIEDIDVAYELSRARKPGETSKIEAIIADAVRTACDHLVPVGFDAFTWKTLLPDERFYLKGLEIESHGETRSGAYQELARGFGIRDYTFMLAGAKANAIRLKTATEFGRKNLGDTGFDASLVRHALFAVRETLRADLEAREGRNWLHTELRDRYWNDRKTLIRILNFFASRRVDLPHWENDAEAAAILAGHLENDHAGAG